MNTDDNDNEYQLFIQMCTITNTEYTLWTFKIAYGGTRFTEAPVATCIHLLRAYDAQPMAREISAALPTGG